jgi:predicted nucleotidyltransferase
MDINYNTKDLEDICSKYQVIYLGVFGSMARGDQNEGSDVDLLVKFSPENRSGLFALSAMRDELQGVLGRKVDLLTEGFLSKYFRDEVLSQTKTLYVKT